MSKLSRMIVALSLVCVCGCGAAKERDSKPKTEQSSEKNSSQPASRTGGFDPSRPITQATKPENSGDVIEKPSLPVKKFSMRKILALPPRDDENAGPPPSETPGDSTDPSLYNPSGGSAPELPAIRDDPNSKIVSVYFGTNRRPRSPPPADDEAEDFYTGKLGPLQYGICRVSVPINREVGSLETATKENRDPATVFVLRRLEVERNGLRWVAGVAETIAAAPPDERDALVFVHGFNVSFADAVYRTAQLKEDLRFSGPALTFSWPSKATLGGYHDDEQTSEKCVADFEQFLRLVLKFSKANQVHIIAHSMGNRVMTPALANIAIQPETDAAPIDQIILAAPDIDAQIFHDQIAPRFVEAGRRRTLYASRNDSALRASFLIHKLAPRLGDAVDHVKGLAIEGIDAQLTDTSLLAHSYYGDQPLVIEDIRAVLAGKLPSERNLVRVFDNSWSFKLADSSRWAWLTLGSVFGTGLLTGIVLARFRRSAP